MPLPRLSDVDACPGALRLHQAADGPLARIRLPGGMITGAQLAALADLAHRWGDAHVEVTSRANAQLRAVNGATPESLAAALSAAGLLPSPTHETVRNIAAPPLAPASIRTLVRKLDEALCADPALAALPGRFLFAVGEVPLTADVAAVPAPAPTGDAFAILFDGADQGLRVAPAEVVPALLAAAHAFLAERAGSARPPAPDGPASLPSGAPRVTTAWRVRELPEGPARVARRTAAALGRALLPGSEPPRGNDAGAPDELIGAVRQGDGLVAVVALIPLGRLTPEQLAVLARADHLVVTPWRGIVLPDLPADAVQSWLRDLAAAGLPVGPRSRWTGVTACAGRPGCHRALADVRADATATTSFVDGLPVHWIGCARGCGSPDSPHVRVEATPAGYAVTTVGVEAGDRAPGSSLAEQVTGARRG